MDGLTRGMINGLILCVLLFWGPAVTLAFALS